MEALLVCEISGFILGGVGIWLVLRTQTATLLVRLVSRDNRIAEKVARPYPEATNANEDIDIESD